MPLGLPRRPPFRCGGSCPWRRRPYSPIVLFGDCFLAPQRHRRARDVVEINAHILGVLGMEVEHRLGVLPFGGAAQSLQVQATGSRSLGYRLLLSRPSLYLTLYLTLYLILGPYPALRE